MAEILGVHLGPDRVAAVRVAADGSMAPLGLGDDLVAPSDQAGVDLVGQAVGGRPEPLTGMLSDLVERAAAVGPRPDRLALVIPDDLDAGARDRVVAAAIAAGVADVVVVPHTAAVAQQPPSDHQERGTEIHLAAGAAVAVYRRPPPIVTREEVDGPAPSVDPPVVPVFHEPSTTASVFDVDEPAPPPVVPTGGQSPSPAPLPTTAIPAVAGPRPREMVEPPDRRVPVWLILAFGVVLVGILAAVALLVLTDDGTDTTTVTDSTTTAVPTTEPAESTTSSSPSSSTSSSTTSSTSSSTSTTTTSSTTTLPPSLGDPGPVTLVETGLQLDSGSVLQFGQDGELIVDEISQVLGDPDDETDFEELEFCFGERHRFVTWGQLEVVIEEVDEDDSRFVEWFTDGSSDPVGLVTVDGLGVGSTVGFLEVNYGTSLRLDPAFEGSEEAIFAVVNAGSGGVLVGVTDGLEPEDTVRNLWAGDACQRTFL